MMTKRQRARLPRRAFAVNLSAGIGAVYVMRRTSFGWGGKVICLVGITAAAFALAWLIARSARSK